MPNENPDMAVQEDAATTPIDLAQAFKMLNQANRESAQENVGAGEDGQPSEPSSDEGNAPEEQQLPVEQGEAATVPVDTGEPANTGGSANSIDAIDFNAYKQDLLRNIQQQARTQVAQEFQKQNIGYYSPAELTVRDEQTGQVRFRNPDVQNQNDPNYYFKSRTEMQSFCESWNKGVDYEYRRAVNEKQQELLKQEAPKARLADFIPKWQAMSDTTKNVFDALLEGHEIRDAQGNEIGFDCDLNAMAARAEKIAKSFGIAQPQQQVQQGNQQQVPASSGPAVDMKTGAGAVNDKPEPKNIGEALKMWDAENRGGKK